MRLTSIRLSGFKSFAESVTIPTSAELTGIVGPNGCGKSNLVDAIRWVMGERSASAMRGDDMQDVIFNGSINRPSINRASVELYFNPVALPDSSPWSRYSELTIKRLMYRNKNSDYFINNQKVRRKDISDLFIGTGLGPHSYAIVEQAMVSRVVDSNPKELRVYLEEAAGVSKYKEKRQESEHRIENTKANLQRIEDIKITIADQVEKLEVQAKVAQKYLAIQNQYLANQRQKAIIELQNLNFQNQELINLLNKEQQKISNLEAKKTEIEKDIVDKESVWQKSQNQLEDIQSNIAAYQAQIAELEQNLRLGEQTRQHLVTDQKKIVERIGLLKEQKTQLQQDIDTQSTNHQNLRLENEQIQTQFKEIQTSFFQNEKILITQKQKFQDLLRRESLAAGIRGAKEQELVSIQNRLQETQLEINNSKKQLNSELNHQNKEDEILDNEFPDTNRLNNLIDEKKHLIKKIAKNEQELSDHIADNNNLNHLIGECKQKESELGGRILTLEQQLSASESLNPKILRSWFESRQMLVSKSLADCLKPDPKWEHAIYIILGKYLSSVYLANKFEKNITSAQIPPDGSLIIDHPDAAVNDQQITKRPGSLAEYINVDDPAFSSWLVNKLNKYICCDSWVDAIQKRNQLATDEYFVSKEGVYLGLEHIVFANKGDSQTVYFENLRAYDDAKNKLENNNQLLQELLQTKEDHNKKQVRINNDLNALRQQLDLKTQAIDDLEAEKLEWQYTYQSEIDRSEWEKSTIEAQIKSLLEQADQLNRQHSLIETELNKTKEDNQAFNQNIAKAQAYTQELETTLLKTRENKHQIEIRLKGNEQQLQYINQDLQRINIQQQKLTQTIDESNQQLESIDSELNQIPDGIEIDDQLQKLITERSSINSQKLKLVELVHQSGENLKGLRSDLQRCFWQIQKSQDKLSELKLKNQESELYAQNFREHYIRYGGDQQDINQLIPIKKIDQNLLNKITNEIDDAKNQMKELEPVNPGAISELETENQKLQNLIKQQTDLSEALSTLADAITRIDIETRERLQQVFLEVNQKFSYFFQKIFGGGYAEIILAGEEILDAGVLIKAQPLGKKNSSIHLLSGGEKALTAIALIFSFFSLNPAPFCVLDEVDAPLDDHNTRLFNDLIQAMKVNTQFLIITHNRITMESMEILTGITMSEPGVSKMVAVDLLNTYKAA